MSDDPFWKAMAYDITDPDTRPSLHQEALAAVETLRRTLGQMGLRVPHRDDLTVRHVYDRALTAVEWSVREHATSLLLSSRDSLNTETPL